MDQMRIFSTMGAVILVTGLLLLGQLTPAPLVGI